MLCPVCRDREVVKIDLTVAGRPVTLRSCSSCDNRWWDQEGELIELRDVIDLASTTRR